MKRVALFIVMSLTYFIASAQSDVTKFLGIPVDGTKSQMIAKLKEKGFTSTIFDSEVLEGEFNGHDVHVYVVTNNNKVYRIMLSDKNLLSETDIKIRFNNLCKQFENNRRYASANDYTIPESEDIGYEMIVNKKRYQAVYYQAPEILQDSTRIASEFTNYMKKHLTAQQIENPTEADAAEIQKLLINYTADLISKKSVWFMISQNLGKYSIAMYYDNEYNKANGEDL